MIYGNTNAHAGMTTLTLILGASDPEMTAIEDLGRQVGAEIRYALSARGERVRADEAYQAVALDAPLPDGTTVYAVECDGPAIPADAVRIDHHRPGDPGYGRPPAEFLPASSIGQVISVLARTGQDRWSCPLGALPLSALGWTFYQGDTPRLDRGAYSCHRECYGWQYPPAREPRAWWIGGWPWQSPQSAGIARVRVPDRIILTAAADHCLAAAYRGECPGVDPDALCRARLVEA